MRMPAARSQQPPAPPVVGYLSSKGEQAERNILAAVKASLAAQGFAEGRNLVIETRWSNGNYNRLPDLAAELMDKGISVLMASGLPATLAAKRATSKVPIVFRLAVDPVAFGLAASLGRPGGNLTGVTMLFDPLTPKKLQLLHELVPNATSIGFLINPKNQNAASHREHALASAADLGVELVVFDASSPVELETALAAAQRAGIGALLVGDDPFFDFSERELVNAVARHALPTMYYVRDFVASGGLVSYGPAYEEMARLAGDYAARILKGAAPADLPISQPTKIELVVNLRTAKALGLTIPVAILSGADEVIE
jgi:putative ABC transport system substrate-binding protein